MDRGEGRTEGQTEPQFLRGLLEGKPFRCPSNTWLQSLEEGPSARLDDRSAHTVGVRLGDLLIVGWGTGTDCGVMAYKNKGGILEGPWALKGTSKTGNEKLVK
ncbi:MAG: hypothetical protein DIJKHBIC_04514 [Thermoanaerobaculia bacterium]|nr:hypothetical protein [Thermoanaerobaculia bacterium]